MLLIDDRGHNPPLIPYFKPFGVEVESTIMDSSDIFFVGNGPSGNVNVGIERKRIADLVNSIRSERLTGFQLDGLLEYDLPALIVEGICRPGRGGELETLQGSGFRPLYTGRQMMLYREISNLLVTLQLVCGVQVIRTGGAEETAAFVSGLYQWFQKDWDQHKAHKGIYAPVAENPKLGGNGKVRLFTKRPKPSLVVKMASQLPGVDQKAWLVGERFKTPLEMVVASEVEWREIEGIGVKGAKKIVEALQDEHWT